MSLRVFIGSLGLTNNTTLSKSLGIYFPVTDYHITQYQKYTSLPLTRLHKTHLASMIAGERESFMTLSWRLYQLS